MNEILLDYMISMIDTKEHIAVLIERVEQVEKFKKKWWGDTCCLNCSQHQPHYQQCVEGSQDKQPVLSLKYPGKFHIFDDLFKITCIKANANIKIST